MRGCLARSASRSLRQTRSVGLYFGLCRPDGGRCFPAKIRTRSRGFWPSQCSFGCSSGEGGDGRGVKGCSEVAWLKGACQRSVAVVPMARGGHGLPRREKGPGAAREGGGRIRLLVA